MLLPRSRPVAFIAALVLFLFAAASTPTAAQPAPTAHKVGSLEITILSTMLADEGFGEWGFAALVTVDGRRILFDTGAHDDTVQRNLKVMGLDLSDVEICSAQPQVNPPRAHPDLRYTSPLWRIQCRDE